jgi:glycosyltransferase involved in cell wall biosynthesis
VRFVTDTVSVVIPCYRQAHFLSEAVDSVLAQSHLAVQPIVVDDGSDDDTAAIAARFGDRIVYVHKPNGGLASARNAGIRAAEGRYVHFLDADDSLHPDALAALVEGMRGDDTHLCLMGFRSFEDNARTWHSERHPPAAFSPLPILIHRNPGPPHCYLCSTAMVHRVGGFDPDLKACEDWDFWIRVALEGVVGVTVPIIGAYYRRHAASMSRNPSLMLTERTRVLLRAHDRIAAIPELYRRCGKDLAEVAHRIRRRLIAREASAELIMQVNRCLRDLRLAGFAIPASVPKQLLDRALGDWGERLVMRYFQRFDPQTWNFYTESFW